MAQLHQILPFCLVLTSVKSVPNEYQNLEKTSSSMLLCSSVRGLCQASRELCRICMDFHPSVVCLSETYLYNDVSDCFCSPGYVVAARWDRSKHGGGVLILIQEHILFKEIDTAAISIAKRTKLVSIVSHSFLLVYCYRQPSSVDVTLLTNVHHLLDTYPLVLPVFCTDFNPLSTIRF